MQACFTQAKVLRVLQESRFTRLGVCAEVRVDVRVIAATTRTSRRDHGRALRQDLFFRLNVIPLAVPRWRSGREDSRCWSRSSCSSSRAAPACRRNACRRRRCACCRTTTGRQRARDPQPGRAADDHGPRGRDPPEHLQLRAAGPGLPWSGELTTLKEARERSSAGMSSSGRGVRQTTCRRRRASSASNGSHFYRKLRALGLDTD